jgi:hypothetical protein
MASGAARSRLRKPQRRSKARWCPTQRLAPRGNSVTSGIRPRCNTCARESGTAAARSRRPRPPGRLTVTRAPRCVAAGRPPEPATASGRTTPGAQQGRAAGLAAFGLSGPDPPKSAVRPPQGRSGELAPCAHPAELPTARRVFDAAAADFGLDEPRRYQVTTAAARRYQMQFGTARPSPEGWSAWARWPQTARSSAPFTTAAASSCSATRDPDPTAEHGWDFRS